MICLFYRLCKNQQFPQVGILLVKKKHQRNQMSLVLLRCILTSSFSIFMQQETTLYTRLCSTISHCVNGWSLTKIQQKLREIICGIAQAQKLHDYQATRSLKIVLQNSFHPIVSCVGGKIEKRHTLICMCQRSYLDIVKNENCFMLTTYALCPEFQNNLAIFLAIF